MRSHRISYIQEQTKTTNQSDESTLHKLQNQMKELEAQKHKLEQMLLNPPKIIIKSGEQLQIEFIKEQAQAEANSQEIQQLEQEIQLLEAKKVELEYEKQQQMPSEKIDQLIVQRDNLAQELEMIKEFVKQQQLLLNQIYNTPKEEISLEVLKQNQEIQQLTNENAYLQQQINDIIASNKQIENMNKQQNE
ncbi:Hypothetical_protein [Hexamita inflata]|uniref:Hypothetical_protein n=1 Tax=Hexamita inflata TaxID=28002 RepID=A0AA86TRU3_9EUKA|nr:Hypothetical protein HINF_LOCUS13590 [Hexamita inflata]